MSETSAVVLISLTGSLSVDLQWRMHEVSDGERRRVQIVQGLMAPWDVLLLDEVIINFTRTWRV